MVKDMGYEIDGSPADPFAKRMEQWLGMPPFMNHSFYATWGEKVCLGNCDDEADPLYISIYHITGGGNVLLWEE